LGLKFYLRKIKKKKKKKTGTWQAAWNKHPKNTSELGGGGAMVVQ